MEIMINEQFKIVSDPLNVIVCERKVSKATKSHEGGQERWDTVSYHRDLPSALRKLLVLQTNRSEATSIEQLLQEQEKFVADIQKAAEMMGNWFERQQETA